MTWFIPEPISAVNPDTGRLRTEPGPTQEASERRWREGLRLDVLWLTITLVVTTLALIVVLQLWRADPHVPMSVGIDHEFTLMEIKNVLREGWVNHTQHLGSPFGQELYDYPVVAGDVLHLLLIKGLGLLTNDPAVVLNCFYGLSFLMVSGAAFVAFRLLKVSPVVASATAVLYSFLPYHFLRGVYYGQLALATYYAIPLVCALVIRQLGDEPLLELRRGRRTSRVEARLTRSRALLALTICVVGALTGVYYAVFAMILLGFAGVARGLTMRSLRPLLSSLVLAAVTAATLLIVLIPNLTYAQRNGSNPEAGRRVATESEIYGLKVVNLVLPTPGHRISALDLQFGEKSVLPGEGTETLGFVGAAGFIGLLLIACRRLLGRSSASSTADSMATLVLFVVLLGTVAGFSAVLASLGFVQIRAWSRLSVVVGFLALGAVALALDHLTARAKASRRGATRLGLSLLVLVVGVADQTTSSFVPRYEEVSRNWRSDQSFFRAVDGKYGEADVFQLPIMPFPESSPVGKLWGWAHFRGYFHSERLRWSFGGMRGRETDWQDQLLPLPGAEAVSRVALAGFEALYIDRYGYSDNGVALERPLEPLLDQPLVSSDGRLAVYDLRPVRRELEANLGAVEVKNLGERALHPMKLRWSSDFGPEIRTEALSIRPAESHAEVDVVNGGSTPQRAVFDFELESSPETVVSVRTDGRPQALRSKGGRERFRLDLLLRPGETKVRFEAQALGPEGPSREGVPRRLPVGYTAGGLGATRFSVLNPRVDEGDRDLAGLLKPVPPGGAAPATIPPTAPPRRPFPPLLMLGAVLIWSVVFTAVIATCLRALLYPQLYRRRSRRTRRPRSAL